MGISKSKKELLCKFKNFTCEICKKKFKLNELNIHRINRGCSYKEHRSLMVICKKCHKKLHYGEFN